MHTGLDDSRVLSVCSAHLSLSMFRWRTSVELRQWMLSRVQCVDMCWLHFSRVSRESSAIRRSSPVGPLVALLYWCVWCVWKWCIPYSIPQMAIWIGTIILRFFRVPDFQTHTKSPAVLHFSWSFSADFAVELWWYPKAQTKCGTCHSRFQNDSFDSLNGFVDVCCNESLLFSSSRGAENDPP